MRKYLLLILCSFCLLLLYGCDREKNELYQNFDTKKAEKIALEYMNGKYDETFRIIRSEKDYEAGYVPGSIQKFWCDVELSLKDSDLGDSYTVRVILNYSSDDYNIAWDNYMNIALVTPLIKREVEKIVYESVNNDYFIYSFDISEKGFGGEIGHSGFSPDFNIDPEKDTLSTLLEKYDLWVCFRVNIPDSVYKKSLISKLKKNLEENCSQTFSGDYIWVEILSFDDGFYSEIKKLNESGNELPPNYEYKAIHEEVIKMK